MTTQPLITTYRPLTFNELVGHKEIVNQLLRAIDSPTCPQAYLLLGPSGTGKTTIARLIAEKLGCEIMEIDAASNNGIDNIRELMSLGQHRSLTGAGRRMFLLNEVQRLSRNAWDGMLTTLEEPPAHLFFALTSTEPDKIPDAVVTRCYTCRLRALPSRDIGDLLDAIAQVEGWEVNGDVRSAIIEAATGQPRKALTHLQAVHDVQSRDEVRRIIHLHDEKSPLIEICKHLLEGKRSWMRIQDELRKVDETDFDEAATICGRYLMAGLLRADSEEGAKRICAVITAMTFPTSTYDKKLAFVTGLGRALWGD